MIMMHRNTCIATALLVMKVIPLKTKRRKEGKEYTAFDVAQYINYNCTSHYLHENITRCVLSKGKLILTSKYDIDTIIRSQFELQPTCIPIYGPEVEPTSVPTDGS